MKHTTHQNARFAIYAILWTVALALMLTGISWLAFASFVFVGLAELFSSRRQPWWGVVVGIIVMAAITADSLLEQLHHGSAFTGKALPLWSCVVASIVWLGAIFYECRKWRRHIEAGHDA